VGDWELWTGAASPAVANSYPGALGLWVEPHTHLRVEQFRLRGEPIAARLDYLGLEALLGAGERPEDWQEQRAAAFRHGLGWISKQPQARVKWNVGGTRLKLWSPRGPDFGEAEIRVDGQRAVVVNLHTEQLAPSLPVWTSGKLPDALHGVVWRALSGLLPVDCLQVEE